VTWHATIIGLFVLLVSQRILLFGRRSFRRRWSAILRSGTGGGAKMGQHEGDDDRRGFGRYVVTRTRHESETSSRQTGGELPLLADGQQGVAFTREDERIGMATAQRP